MVNRIWPHRWRSALTSLTITRIRTPDRASVNYGSIKSININIKWTNVTVLYQSPSLREDRHAPEYSFESAMLNIRCLED